jgi:ABC-type oligopeptide transport system ATPase subunit
MIIHICGAIGSGKTTLGKELLTLYKGKIIVKDLDNLLNQYTKTNKFTSKGYQKYIDNFIEKHNNKIIVFVGINQDMGRTKTLYKLKPDYKFFINLNIKENARRRFVRDYKNDVKYFFLWKYSGSEPSSGEIYEEWIKDEKMNTKRLQNIIEEMSPLGLEKNILQFHNKYRKLDYKFMSAERIVEKISKIISDEE